MFIYIYRYMDFLVCSGLLRFTNNSQMKHLGYLCFRVGRNLAKMRYEYKFQIRGKVHILQSIFLKQSAAHWKTGSCWHCILSRFCFSHFYWNLYWMNSVSFRLDWADHVSTHKPVNRDPSQQHLLSVVSYGILLWHKVDLRRFKMHHELYFSSEYNITIVLLLM